MSHDPRVPFARLLGPLIALAGLASTACATGETATNEASAPRDLISILSPRCAGVESCVLGHVTTTRNAVPVARAAVFLERELQPGEDEPVRIQTLTDEQGVFTIDDPPPGSYRIAVYKEASSVEVVGMELGRAGTTMLPVRLGIR